MSDFGFWILDFGLARCCVGPTRFRERRSHTGPRTARLAWPNPKSKIQNPKCPRAFTLIEVLIAIALLLALMGTMYGFSFDMLSSRAHALEHVKQQTAAAALIKQLDADLMACVAGNSVLGGGVRGGTEHLRVLSRGVEASRAAQGPDEVFSDLQLTEYRFDPQRRGIDVRRGSATPATTEPGSFSNMEGIVYKLRFRYHDGENWRETFDSLTQERLPVAVEVALWLAPLPDDDDGPPDRVRTFMIPDAASEDAQVPASRDESSREGEAAE